MITINTLGKSNLEAVNLTRNALNEEPEQLKILVDGPGVAAEIKKFLETQSYNVVPEDDGRKLILTGTKSTALEPSNKIKIEPVQIQNQNLNQTPAQNNININNNNNIKRTTGFLFTGKNFSRENKKYGRIFLRKVIESLTKLNPRPDVIALMNEGVKLAVYDSSSCDLLKDLEAKGCRILVSGMCADNFGLTESIGAGRISAILDILEIMLKCDKVVSL